MLKKRIDNRRKIPATIQKQAAEIADLAISEHSKSVILRNAAMVEVLLYGRYCGLRSIAKVAQAAGMQDRALQMLLERGQKEFNRDGGKAHTAQALFFLYFHETRANLDLELLDRARENAMNSRRPKDQLDVLKAVSPEYSYDPNGAGAQQIGMQLNQQNVYKIGNETIYGIDPETAQICNQLLALPKKEFLKYMTDLSFSCAQNRGENVTIEHIGSLVEKSMGSSWTPENEKIEAENELNRLVYGDDWRKEIEKIKRGEPVGDEIINAEITPDGIEPPVENIEIEKESEDSDNAE